MKTAGVGGRKVIGRGWCCVWRLLVCGSACAILRVEFRWMIVVWSFLGCFLYGIYEGYINASAILRDDGQV